MTLRRQAAAGVLALVVVAVAGAACSTRTPPSLPGATSWRQPEVPRDLASRTADVATYELAWNRIRRGDLRGGERDLADLWKNSSTFYPAVASVGELRLQRQQFRDAAAMFTQALSLNSVYVPALAGLVDARLGAGDDPGALAALQALLAVDSGRIDARDRLDAVRLRVSQGELTLAERFRAAGQWDDAERHLTKALEATPENGPVLRALATVQFARGALEAAESRARQAIALDPQDAASLALLGDVLEARGSYGEAAAAYARATAIEARPAWNARRTGLQERAQASALPEAYRLIESAPSVTRADVAAVLGVRLAALLARAPIRVTDVVTDVRGHWAAAWILSVVRAGWIEVRPNHTFQPSGSLRRADLAHIVVAVLGAEAAVTRSLPTVTFADVPRDHAAYRSAAYAVSTGIMTVDASNRFQPAGAVSGAELLAVVARLEARAR